MWPPSLLQSRWRFSFVRYSGNSTSFGFGKRHTSSTPFSIHSISGSRRHEESSQLTRLPFVNMLKENYFPSSINRKIINVMISLNQSLTHKMSILQVPHPPLTYPKCWSLLPWHQGQCNLEFHLHNSVRKPSIKILLELLGQTVVHLCNLCWGIGRSAI